MQQLLDIQLYSMLTEGKDFAMVDCCRRVTDGRLSLVDSNAPGSDNRGVSVETES